ncbi:S1 family serine peptidase [Acinetobacter modestus]|nr:serine protease [Acinetobacter modestus]
MKKYFIMLSALFCIFIQNIWANISPQPRIINGDTASEAQMPWQVALVTNPLDAYQSYVCSGSLIADRWVVTAAHCAEQLKKLNKDYYVLVGTNNLQDNQQAQIIKVKQSYIHEQYNNRIYDNDLALLELERAVDFIKCGINCQTIDLINPVIEKQNAPITTLVKVAGWGVLEDCENSQSGICQQYSGKMIRNPQLYPTTLRYTTLKLTHCLSSSSLYQVKQITENMLCAESPVQYQPRDTCLGDSGAGLTIENDFNRPYLLGIASWGVGCAKSGYPGVYTRVANYNSWINRYIHPETASEQNAISSSTSGGSVSIFVLLMLLGLSVIRWWSIQYK